KKDLWTGIYQLAVADPDGGQRRTVATQASLIPLDQDEPAQSADQQAFGAKGWRCYVPELRLLFETQPAESALPSLPVLTDPAQARALLEQHIRAAAPAYRDLQIETCTPRVVRYKPGSRCTILYDLTYPADAESGHSWPNLVAVKTYKGS